MKILSLEESVVELCTHKHPVNFWYDFLGPYLTFVCLFTTVYYHMPFPAGGAGELFATLIATEPLDSFLSLPMPLNMLF